MKGFLEDPGLIIRSIDTDGPAPDVRPAKVFESYVLPEMIQNRLLKDMPADACVELGIGKLVELIKT
jgi:multiple sugar transport system substrate-binding protein